MAQMEDAVGIYRRLWRGEAIFGHDGPAGKYPLLSLDPTFDEDIPVMAACLGFKTMRWAGRVLDGVILHTFVTDEPWPAAWPRYGRAPKRRGGTRPR